MDAWRGRNEGGRIEAGCGSSKSDVEHRRAPKGIKCMRSQTVTETVRDAQKASSVAEDDQKKRRFSSEKPGTASQSDKRLSLELAPQRLLLLPASSVVDARTRKRSTSHSLAIKPTYPPSPPLLLLLISPTFVATRSLLLPPLDLLLLDRSLPLTPPRRQRWTLGPTTRGLLVLLITIDRLGGRNDRGHLAF